MPKKVDDIVPRELRSIRNIPIPEGRKRSLNLINNIPITSDPVHTAARPIPSDIRPPAPPPPPPPMPRKVESAPLPPYRDYVPPKPTSGKHSRAGMWLGGLVVLIAAAFGVMTLISRATLAYTPKNLPVTLQNQAVTLYKNGSGDKIPFSIIQITSDKSVDATASGQAQVSDKATGRLIVYNNASTDAQKLIKNTRFETTDGKIFRVGTDISIPGKTTAADGSVVPGSLEVTVTADQPGPDYNIPLSDFTIPGLKGDPRYSTIYARSKTPMAGGFVGTRASVNPTDLASAKATIESGLKDDLMSKVSSQVPADYVLFPDLSTITYDSLPQGSSTGETVTIGERGNFSGVMVKKSDLASYLATRQGATVSGPVTIGDGSSLKASFGSSTPDLSKADTLAISLDGSATVTWVTDEKALAAELSGKSKSDLDGILKGYPSIQSAEATIQPFWKSSFPSNAEKITIKRNG